MSNQQRYILRCFAVGLVAFLLSSSTALSQQSSRGRDFYITYLPNYHELAADVMDSLFVFIVASEPTTGTLTYTDATDTIRTISFSITNASTIKKIGVWWKEFEPQGYTQGSFFTATRDNEKIQRRSMRLQTSHLVSCYSLSLAARSSDATLVFPVEALGTNYTVLSYNSHGQVSGGAITGMYAPSQFSIVATEDNTTVTITPSAPTSESGMNVKTMTLQRGETWMCQAYPSADTLNHDLTGTTIQASKRIAVFSGHQRALVTYNSTTLLSRDHLYDQILPTSMWGSTYIVTPFAQPSDNEITGADRYRVVASENNTEVQFNNVLLARLNTGQVYDDSLVQAGLIRANKPIAVATYKRSHSTVAGGFIKNGDPMMMIVPPRRQYLNSYRFQCVQAQEPDFSLMPRTSFTEHYVTIVVPKSATDSVRLDGNSITQPFTDIPLSCYSYVSVPVSDGVHTATCSQPIALYVYGYGLATSYGYLGGMAFLPDAPEPFLSVSADQSLCQGDSVTIVASGNMARIRWTPSQSVVCDTCFTTKAFPTQTTRITALAIDSLGCTLSASTNLQVISKPTLVALRDTTVCEAATITLTAQGSFESIEWSPSSGLSCATCPQTTVIPDGRSGVRTYTLRAKNGSGPICEAIQTIRIRYTNLPSDIITENTAEICLGDTARVRSRFTSGLRITPNTNWSISNDILKFYPATTTTYTIVTDSAGCSILDTITIRVVTKPTIALPNDTTLCEGQTLRLFIQSSTPNVRWITNTLVDDSLSIMPWFTPTAPGTYSLIALAYSGATCIAYDTMTVTIAQQPKLSILVSDTTLCNGQSAIITLTASTQGTLTITPMIDVQKLTDSTYQVRPSTSTSYTIRLQTPLLCSVELTQRITVENYPTIDAGTDTNVCAGSLVLLKANSTHPQVSWYNSQRNIVCNSCTNTTVTPDSSQWYYAVSTNSLGCESTDSIFVRVSALPVLQMISDTLICNEGGFAILWADSLAARQSTIQWQPSSLITSPTSWRTLALPQQTTRFTATLTSPDGCITTKDVLVSVERCVKSRAIVATQPQPFLACDNAEHQLTITANGNVPVAVSSIKILRSKNFFVNPEVLAKINTFVLPTIINSKNDCKVLIPFNVEQPGQYSVEYEISTDAGDSIVQLAGTTYTEPAQFTMSGDFVTLGDIVTFIVDGKSPSWDALKIQSMEVLVSYKPDELEYVGASIGGSLPNDWRIVSAIAQRNATPAYVRLYLSGTTPIERNGVVVSPRFQTLLNNNFSFKPELSVSLPNRRVDCVTIQTSSDSLLTNVCAKSLRKVEIGGAALFLDNIYPNPVTKQEISIHYGVPFFTGVDIEIVNSAATQRKKVIQSTHIGGEYTVSLPINDLPNGMYYCHMRAMGSILSMPFVIHR